MGERAQYADGTFSWADLGTSDAAGAKEFYGRLFGWEGEDLPAGEGVAYTMLQLGGNVVAALYQAPPAQPTAWLSYITVTDLEDVCASVPQVGGMLIQEPFEVLDAGRMALAADPTGGAFALWEPGDHIGAGVVNAPGALTLNQLNTTDPDRAAEFYRELFGWHIERLEVGNEPYWGIYNGTALNGGMMQLPAGSPAPPHWLVYFGSEDVDEDKNRINEYGGRIVFPPTSIPGGRILVARDPQGAYFGLFSGRFDA